VLSVLLCDGLLGSMLMADFSADVVVVGAGPVGLVLACALADGGLKVLVVDRADVENEGVAVETQRVVAVNRASEFVLSHLGVWQDLSADAVCPFKDIHVWQAFSASHVRFSASEVGQADLGAIVSVLGLKQVLLSRVLAHSNISLLAPEVVVDFSVGGERVEVVLKSGVQCHAKLLVGADGQFSQVRKLAGFSLNQRFYGDHALVSTISCEKPHEACARQRFLASGPLALLPLADPHQCSIVWSAPPELCDEWLALSDEDFCRVLSQASEFCLGRVVCASPRLSFPLYEQSVGHYVQDRVALVGDAAHTIHPLAGQGVNLGFLDAACLAQVVLEHSERQRDFGRLAYLEPYHAWRAPHNQQLRLAMSFFREGFKSENSVLSFVRSLGLLVSNRSFWLKRFWVHHALGLAGELPDLARSS